MSSPADLLKAIRTGKLPEVIAALDAGAGSELNDESGHPGLPIAMACFMGHSEIVRELILRGAHVNFPDNSVAASPLSMAIRGKRQEVIKVLIENGAVVPPGADTGLSESELMLARWRAQHFGPGSKLDSDAPPVIEEINVDGGCYGTDTNILDTEMQLADRLMRKKQAR
ncbi:ankyrin repeat domain-containing protein [Propionivibrio limicola]|uniref:ankyrin repeat domain-containing protein n=1 Tax=Propionivibrio limicola TaxID=167645 RepID=UPI0012918395|nr:ankyrin repeat domain-containing protein [Propionivibrio limicola]